MGIMENVIIISRVQKEQENHRASAAIIIIKFRVRFKLRCPATIICVSQQQQIYVGAQGIVNIVPRFDAC
jgi:hypothetical protein